MEQRAWTLTRWSPEMRALDSAPHHRLLERWSSNPTLRMRLQRTGRPSAAGHLHAREQSERMARNAEEPLASLPKLCGVILRGWVRARTHCSRPTRILVASPFSAAPREDLTAHGGVEVQGLACRRTPGRGFGPVPDYRQFKFTRLARLEKYFCSNPPMRNIGRTRSRRVIPNGQTERRGRHDRALENQL